MPKTSLKLLLGSVLLVASQACAPPVPATPDPNVINTAIAQTLAAGQTQTSQPSIPITGDETPTPSVTVGPTFTAIVLPSISGTGTETPTPSLTAVPSSTAIVLPSPVFTLTPAVTPSVAQLTVSVPTNCRTGPGTAYDRVGGLQVGEVAEVVGRHASRDYWIIRNPDRPSQVCWLWGEYATVAGNIGVLPEFTPPPTPTPSPGFDASFSRLEGCPGTGWWVDIELENTGGLTFQSIAMTVRDTVNNTDFALYSDDFINRDGCNRTASRDNLPAGEQLVVSSPAITRDPREHQFRASITLCSNPGQSGVCATEVITFTP